MAWEQNLSQFFGQDWKLPSCAPSSGAVGTLVSPAALWDLAMLSKIVLALYFGFLLSIIIHRSYFSSLAKYPGPWLAKVSSLWAMQHAHGGNWSKDVFALHQKHGHFVRITHKEVSTTHPDAIRTILHSSFDKGDWYKIWAMPDSTLQSVQSTISAHDASRRQRNIANGYTLSTIMQSEAQMDDVLRNMRACFMDLAGTGKPVSLGDVLAWAAFDVAGEVTFSHRFGMLDARQDIEGAIASTEDMMVYGVTMGYALLLNTMILDNILVRNLNRWLNFTGKMHIVTTALGALASREKNPSAKHDMVALWFDNLSKAEASSNRGKMARSEVTAAAIGNVGGGSETISATVQSVMYHLIRTPHALKLARAEIDAATAAGELSTIPVYKEVSRLSYLQACVKEGFRMHPAGPWNLSRVSPSPSGVTLGDQHFLPGVQISVNPWIIHHSSSFFHRPESFEPERWLDDGQRKREEPFWIPFGGGYNRCPGRQLALIEVPKMAVIMIRDFEYTLVEPGKEWRWRNNFTALPKGWDCRVSIRDIKI